ncbi:hypothetical protein CEXT_262221 [Caerostris extrusa]|uniref:Uncharacterized protein n=1 Tax=Caerostris extrusa TaxID=172846 RepID=A0AAV4NH22_CAEEX|nr:hypothetical protein CEXT_262221 [Caerostris extrusa]
MSYSYECRMPNWPPKKKKKSDYYSIYPFLLLFRTKNSSYSHLRNRTKRFQLSREALQDHGHLSTTPDDVNKPILTCRSILYYSMSLPPTITTTPLHRRVGKKHPVVISPHSLSKNGSFFDVTPF